jgi:hypothetical protein
VSRAIAFLVLKDPDVGFVESKLDEWDVIAVEARGFIPDVALAEQTNDGDGVPKPGACALPPDADSDQAFAKFMYW